MIQFDEHIFHKWVVQPPTRQFFANFFFGVISRGLPWVFCLGSRWGHVFWKTKFRHAGTLADVEDGHWRGKGRKLQTYREFENTNWAKKKGILGYIEDEILFPVFLEIIIHQCKDPVIKQPVWLMESIRLFLLLLLNFSTIFKRFLDWWHLLFGKTPVFVDFFRGKKPRTFSRNSAVSTKQQQLHSSSRASFVSLYGSLGQQPPRHRDRSDRSIETPSQWLTGEILVKFVEKTGMKS